MDKLQQLAVMDAVYKELGKRRNALKDEVSDKAKQLYMEQGADRLSIQLNGQKVGTLSMVFEAPVDGVFPQVEDSEEFAQWFRSSDGGLDALRRLVAVKPELMLEAATADGELPDGCAMVERHEPGKLKTPALRVQAKKVAQALGSELPQAIAGMLEGE